MDWLRWWHGTLTDPKFGWVAKKSGQPLTAVICLWVALLERASSVTQRDAGVTRGSVAGFDCDDFDVFFDLEDGGCRKIFDAMVAKKMIVDEFIARWNERQPQREDSSAERTRAYRERQKKARESSDDGSNSGDAARDDVTHGDATTLAGDDKKRVDKSKRKPKPSSSSGDDGFDAFWLAYPRKEGKITARKAWAKLKADAELQNTILTAIAAQLEGDAWKREDGQFIPHPATWLNGGRWLDEVRPYTPPPLKLPAGWWESSEGMKAAGAMLTPPLTPNKGEYPREFAARIRAALGQIDAPQGAAPAAAPEAPEPYIPPAPPADVILTDEQREARRVEFREQLAKLRGAAGNLPIQPRNKDSEVPA
jgi:hypothetical protein